VDTENPAMMPRVIQDVDDVRTVIFMVGQMAIAMLIVGVFAVEVYRGDTIEPELAFVIGGIVNFFYDSARRRVTVHPPNGAVIEPDLARERAK